MQNSDEFCANYFDEITDMVRLLHHSFSFYKNDGWKWISQKGLYLLLDIDSTLEKYQLHYALERLNIKSKHTTLNDTLYEQSGVFFYLPAYKPHLQDKVDELKKQVIHRELKPPTFKPKPCLYCGTVFLPQARSEKYCCDECKTTVKRNRAREYYHKKKRKQSDSQRD